MASEYKNFAPTDIFSCKFDRSDVQRGASVKFTSQYNFSLPPLGSETIQQPGSRVIVLRFTPIRNAGVPYKRLVDVGAWCYSTGGTYSYNYLPSAGYWRYWVFDNLETDKKVTDGTYPADEFFVDSDEMYNTRRVTDVNTMIFDAAASQQTFLWLHRAQDLSALLEAEQFIDIILSGVLVYAGELTNGRRYGISFEGSVLTTQPLYLRCLYEDVTPYVEDAYPTAGFVNEQQNNVFGWKLGYDPAGVTGAIVQQSAVFEWREKDSQTVNTINVSGDRGRVTVPANTFASQAIEWRVTLTSNAGISSEPSPWYELSTVDSISTALPVYPVDTVIAAQDDNYFIWNHVIDTGTPQTKFDLQYKTETGDWAYLAQGVIGDTTGYLVPANTFSPGLLSWRVRTYNSDGAAGNWSIPAIFTVRGKPAPPSISGFTETPQPFISWQSAEQEAYQVRIGDWTSDIIFGTRKNFTYHEFLNDGEVRLSVRIQNLWGEWSNWANVNALITNIPRGNIALTSSGRTHNDLRWKADGSSNMFLIYRNGIKIGAAKDLHFRDNLATGKHKYFVRGTDGTGYYALSNEIVGIAQPEHDLLAEIPKSGASYDWMELKYTGPSVNRGRNLDLSVTYTHYSGRALPVATTAEFESSVATFSYRFRTDQKEVYDRVKALKGKLVVWKNAREVHIGILNTLSEDESVVNDLSFNITETDTYTGESDEDAQTD
jgi:hypothetical protein